MCDISAVQSITSDTRVDLTLLWNTVHLRQFIRVKDFKLRGYLGKDLGPVGIVIEVVSRRTWTCAGNRLQVTESIITQI